MPADALLVSCGLILKTKGRSSLADGGWMDLQLVVVGELQLLVNSVELELTLGPCCGLRLDL